MRKEVNYIEAQREKIEMLESMKLDNIQPEISDDLEELHLRIEHQEIVESQYTRIRNEKSWHIWVDLIYPWLEQEASIQGLHVIFDVNEEKLTGKITISGEFFVINNMWGDSKKYFEIMEHYSNDLWFSSQDGLFVTEVLFDMYDKIQTADKTEEIEKAKQAFAASRLKHGKKAQFKVKPEQ